MIHVPLLEKLVMHEGYIKNTGYIPSQTLRPLIQNEPDVIWLSENVLLYSLIEAQFAAVTSSGRV
jgi:hypothetical protein